MSDDFSGTEKHDLIIAVKIALSNLDHAFKYSNHTDDMSSGFRAGQKVAYEAILAYLIEDEDFY